LSAVFFGGLGGQGTHATCTCAVKVVISIVIINFVDQATEDIYNGLDTKHARHIPSVVWRIAARKLDLLNAAHELKDLRIPPSNRLKALKGKYSSSHSIRINDQFRIVFKWFDGQAKDVEISDYH
jgi:toxin HigB-1